LRLLIEAEASPFFRSRWRESHCSSVKKSLPPMVTGSEGGSCSRLKTALRQLVTSIDSSEKSSNILIAMATYEYFGTARRSFSTALLVDVVIVVPRKLLYQGVEAESEVIDVFTWFES
jgi:hypothetical protein